MNIEKLLEKQSKNLSAQKEIKSRIKENVFSQIDSKNNLFERFFAMKYINSPLVKFSIIFIFIIGFITIPAGYKFITENTSEQSIGVEYSETEQRDNSGSPINDYFEINSQESRSENSRQKDVENFEDSISSESERIKQKDANLILGTDKVEERYEKIQEIVRSNNGYLKVLSFNSDNGVSEGFLSIQIPVNSFESILSEIKNLDVRIISESINISDKQNEILEIKNDTEDLKSSINELEKRLDSEELSEEEKERIRSTIDTYKNQINSNKDKQEEIIKENSFSTIDIEIVQDGDSDQDEKSLTEIITENLEYTLKFWSIVAIWACIPISLIGIIGFLVFKFSGKFKINKSKR